MADELDIPEGLMRVWDAQQKKIILVPAPAQGTDRLTFTLRLHDPREKLDRESSTSWVVVQIPRADLSLTKDEFIARYILPNLAQLKLLTLQ